MKNRHCDNDREEDPRELLAFRQRRPQHGDQKVNADIVERIGLGTWVKSWGWGQETVVNRAEIAEKIREIMGNESLRILALGIKEEARKAVGAGGSSNKGLSELINIWRKF